MIDNTVLKIVAANGAVIFAPRHLVVVVIKKDDGAGSEVVAVVAGTAEEITVASIETIDDPHAPVAAVVEALACQKAKRS